MCVTKHRNSPFPPSELSSLDTHFWAKTQLLSLRFPTFNSSSLPRDNFKIYYFILHDCISIYTVLKHVLIFIAFGLRFCLEIFTT